MFFLRSLGPGLSLLCTEMFHGVHIHGIRIPSILFENIKDSAVWAQCYMYAYNPSTLEADVGEPVVRGQPQLLRELEATLG